MLTEQQKIDVRRHAGYSVYGSDSSSPPSISYRYTPKYMNLEYMMNNLAPEEEVTLISVYVTPCNELEAGILKSACNLDTASAAVWYHNPKELEQRKELYVYWCKRLMDFLATNGPAKTLSGMQVIV